MQTKGIQRLEGDISEMMSVFCVGKEGTDKGRNQILMDGAASVRDVEVGEGAGDNENGAVDEVLEAREARSRIAYAFLVCDFGLEVGRGMAELLAEARGLDKLLRAKLAAC